MAPIDQAFSWTVNEALVAPVDQALSWSVEEEALVEPVEEASSHVSKHN